MSWKCMRREGSRAIKSDNKLRRELGYYEMRRCSGGVGRISKKGIKRVPMEECSRVRESTPTGKVKIFRRGDEGATRELERQW